MKSDKNAPHVLIVGGGFGGLAAARALARQPVRVTLLDRRNFHLFQPLLYEVATAAQAPSEIAHPLRAIFSRHTNIHVLMAEVTAVELACRRVRLREGDTISYDFLIVAAGAAQAYFGREEWRPLAPGLKTVEDALEIRRRILSAYELAEREADPQARQALLTFIVVGGGPTGVELAGAIAEIAQMTLKHDFRAIDPAHTRILLLQSGPHVLDTYPDELSLSAERQLRQLGVQIRTHTRVTGITKDGVCAGNEFIPARTVLWTAGVVASPLAQTLDVPLERGGRVLVNEDLTVPGHPEAYVIGDLASFSHQTGAPLPGIAPVAIQQGRAAATNITYAVRGQPRRRFHYVDRGSLATIGRAAAVADLGRFHLSGLPAWLAWLLVHVYFLIGFDNRVQVLFRWAWSYFTYQRGARLITDVGYPYPQDPNPHPQDPNSQDEKRQGDGTKG